MIVHASISENGTTGWDGKAKSGDQTGKEVCSRTYYSNGWNILIRCNDYNIAEKASEIAIKLANSNLVGYDQSQRNTLYSELKKNNFDVDKYILSGVKTETDCSAFQYAIYCCLMPEMRSDNNAPRTATMRNFYSKYNFTIYTDSKYLTSDKYLKKGDILVREGKHTIQNVTNGMYADLDNTSNVQPSSTTYTKTQFIKDIQSATGAKVDGIAGTETLSKTVTVSKTKNNRHAVVKPIQKYLNSLGYNCGTVDGIAGNLFDNAVKLYQKNVVGMKTPDGEFTKGGNSWKYILGLK